MIGKTIEIAGMTIEIIADDGEKYRCRNITTGETLSIEKTMLDNAIKLGKADIVPDQDENR